LPGPAGAYVTPGMTVLDPLDDSLELAIFTAWDADNDV
jgi:hypothetical protein